MTACLIDHALGESKNVEGLCAVKGWQRNAPVAVEWLGQDRRGGGEEDDSGKKQQKASFHGDLLFCCAPRLDTILLLLSKDG